MRKNIYWLLPIIWMGVIFYSSAQPYQDQDIKPLLTNTMDLSFLIPIFDWVSFTYHHSEVSIDALGVAGFIEFFIRKGAHVTVFFILVCLFFMAIIKSTRLDYKPTLLISFLLTVAYAGIDEFHQGYTANRTPYLGDVFLDAFGAGIAYLLLIWWKKKFGYRTTKNE